jgi:hypothetical protein
MFAKIYSSQLFVPNLPKVFDLQTDITDFAAYVQ